VSPPELSVIILGVRLHCLPKPDNTMELFLCHWQALIHDVVLSELRLAKLQFSNECPL